MIKNIDERIIAEGFHTGHEVDVVTIQKSDDEQLKEQAERVQELEQKLAEIRFVNNDYDKINKRYRDLLEKIKEMTRYDDCREAEIYELVSDELEGESE